VKKNSDNAAKSDVKAFTSCFLALLVLIAVSGKVAADFVTEEAGLVTFIFVLIGIIDIAMISYLFYRLSQERINAEKISDHKSNYIMRLSHELRTPVNAIYGMTEIAKNTQDEKKIAYCLDRVDDAAKHILGVISDTLEMSTIETGELEVSTGDIVVAEILNRAIAVLGLDVAEKHQELVVHIGEEVPQAIVGDVQMLTQVITNLLSNAHESTPSGGRISVSVEAVEHNEHEHLLRFAVADNGIGTSEEQKAILLATGEDDSWRYSGTNLTLAITRHLIQKMGGKVWVETELAQGSRIIFDLWAREGQAVKAVILKNSHYKRDAEAMKDVKFPDKHILLVEDIEINREIVAGLLEDTEVAIDYAENGLEAVAMFSESIDKYDLIFMDIKMPQMDGYAATAKIRAMDAVQARNIPIIAMTANVFKEDAEHCINAGMNGHISKPIDRAEVLWAMQRFIV
jgi:signal transduction histidine kinase/CheY-like chemotaxis protein